MSTNFLEVTDKHFVFRIRRPTYFDIGDALVLSALCAGAVILSAVGLSQFNDALYSDLGWDRFVGADTPRVFWNMTQVGSHHGRTSVHPLFSILVLPISQPLIWLGLSPIVAGKVMVASAAGLTAGLFYVAMRRLALPVYAAALSTGVLISSGSFIYWFSVIETYSFAALSICAMLVVLFAARPPPLIVWVLASAFTLSITVTNWMLGLSSAFFRLPFRKFAMVSIAAFLLVAALALLQRHLLPTASLFFSPSSVGYEYQFTQISQEERGYKTWDPIDNVIPFFVYSVAVPSHHMGTRDLPLRVAKPRGLAIALWLLLLGGGVWGVIRTRELRIPGAAMGSFIAGQLALHSVYGEDVFLYSAHFTPVLVALAACAYFTPMRRLCLALALLLIVVNGTGNFQRFISASVAVNEMLKVNR